MPDTDGSTPDMDGSMMGVDSSKTDAADASDGAVPVVCIGNPLFPDGGTPDGGANVDAGVVENLRRPRRRLPRRPAVGQRGRRLGQRRLPRLLRVHAHAPGPPHRTGRRRAVGLPLRGPRRDGRAHRRRRSATGSSSRRPRRPTLPARRCSSRPRSTAASGQASRSRPACLRLGAPLAERSRRRQERLDLPHRSSLPDHPSGPTPRASSPRRATRAASRASRRSTAKSRTASRSRTTARLSTSASRCRSASIRIPSARRPASSPTRRRTSSSRPTSRTRRTASRSTSAATSGWPKRTPTA